MLSFVQKTPLDYSSARITICPELPSPRTPALTTDLYKRQQNSGENPEFRPDPKSASGFNKIDQNSDWKGLVTEIQRRLKTRGIVKDVAYISDNLSTYAHEIQADIDAEDEADRAAELAEFNAHISKLTPKYAAIMVLRIRERWTFTPIGKLLNISDQQADNLFQEAEKYFNSDLFQVGFLGHEITLDTPVDTLISILNAGANPVKSPAGRKPKPKKAVAVSANADLFAGVM